MDWHYRFLMLAAHVAEWSKDPSTKTGAVIARPDRTVVSLGYNGFPRGVGDTPARLEDRNVKYDLMIHCEMNAVLSAHDDVRGCALYTWPFASCIRCAVHMVQAGIGAAVFPTLPERLTERWAESVRQTKKIYDESGVTWIEIPPK